MVRISVDRRPTCTALPGLASGSLYTRMMSRWRRLGTYVRPHRWTYAAGLASTMAASMLALAAPAVLRTAVDDLAGGTPGGTPRYAAAILGLALASGAFRFLTRRLVIGVSRHIEHAIRTDLFAHLQRLDLQALRRLRTGDLMSRATADIAAVRMLVGPAVMYSAGTGLTFVAGVWLMWSIDPWLTLVAMAPLPFVSLAVRGFGRTIHDRFERIQAQLSEVSVFAQESLAAVRIVRAYGRGGAELARFRAASDELVQRNRALIAVQGIYAPSMGLLMGAGALLVLWLGSRDVMAGRITVGSLVAFNAYLAMLGWPMVAFGWVANLLQRGGASWSRLQEVFDTVPRVSDEAASGVPIGADALRGAIEVRGLTFGYEQVPVLRDVSFTVRPGARLGIIGPTGSGKTTLAQLLVRLYDPPTGTVFLDGVDVRHLPLAVLRAAIALVPQEPFLFGESLAVNIGLGAREDGVPRERIARAAETAGLDADLHALPQGLETVVGERGVTLSGGQKQRVAIARALVGGARVLVLDDAFSAVDTLTESGIRARLARDGDSTTIVIAHRVATVASCDEILVLQEGRVVERGPHHVLLALNGRYARLHRQQQLEAELAAS